MPMIRRSSLLPLACILCSLSLVEASAQSLAPQPVNFPGSEGVAPLGTPVGEPVFSVSPATSPAEGNAPAPSASAATEGVESTEAARRRIMAERQVFGISGALRAAVVGNGQPLADPVMQVLGAEPEAVRWEPLYDTWRRGLLGEPVRGRERQAVQERAAQLAEDPRVLGEPVGGAQEPAVQGEPARDVDRPAVQAGAAGDTDGPRVLGEPVGGREAPSVPGEPARDTEGSTVLGAPVGAREGLALPGESAGAERSALQEGPAGDADGPRVLGEPVGDTEAPGALSELEGGMEAPALLGEPVRGAEGPRVLGEPVGGSDRPQLLGEPVARDAVIAPDAPGVWRLRSEESDSEGGDATAERLAFITTVPFSAKRGAYLNGYHIGYYPTEGSSRADIYAPPAAFIEVTPENQDLQISEHFRLRQFLTKDQFDVWPKYLVLNLRLIDKLELVLQELNRMGVRALDMHVMSGFRTPQYNGPGGDGRAALSRHMYGDAADVWVDGDHDGYIDDLNGDGRHDIADAAVLLRAVERVEQRYPELIGGAGLYEANAYHGPFVHIDVRGARARW